MISQINNLITNYISINNFSIIFLLISFLGGILASISPCSIGIIPLIIGYIGGYGDNNKFKTLIQLCSFVFGLAVVLSIIGAFCAITGNVFISIGGNYWILFLSSLILILGLNLLGIIQINFSPIIKKFPSGNNASLFVYPFLIGILFAFASSPCSTPILAGIMSFASLTKSFIQSALMLFFFSLGQGIIIVLAGIFTSFLKNLKGFANTSGILIKLSGILLVLASILIYIKVFSKFF